MAVLGVELTVRGEYDGTDYIGTGPLPDLLLSVFTQEGSHTEPTSGQIWPRLA